MKLIFPLLTLVLCMAQFSVAQVDPRWKANDPDRPLPLGLSVSPVVHVRD